MFCEWVKSGVSYKISNFAVDLKIIGEGLEPRG